MWGCAVCTHALSHNFFLSTLSLPHCLCSMLYSLFIPFAHHFLFLTGPSLFSPPTLCILLCFELCTQWTCKIQTAWKNRLIQYQKTGRSNLSFNSRLFAECYTFTCTWCYVCLKCACGCFWLWVLFEALRRRENGNQGLLNDVRHHFMSYNTDTDLQKHRDSGMYGFITSIFSASARLIYCVCGY